MSKYKERLWRELVREHGAELARISRPARHGRVARPRLLAGTTVGLAGLGTAIALLLSAASSSPAFAVTQNHDGTVRVVIWRIDALHSVNARLAQLGFRARFVQVAPGCAAPPPALLAAALARKQVKADWVKAKNGSLTAKFDPKQIPLGRTLVVTAWRHGQAIKVGPGHIVVGATPNCVRTFAAAPGGVVRMYGKGDVVHCVVAGALQPADNPPSDHDRRRAGDDHRQRSDDHDAKRRAGDDHRQRPDDDNEHRDAAPGRWPSNTRAPGAGVSAGGH